MMSIRDTNLLRRAGPWSVRNAALRVGFLPIAVVCFFGAADAKRPQHDKTPRTVGRRLAGSNIARVSEERTGEMTTREGLRLRVIADQGDILIKTMSEASSPETAKVTYRVRIETDARTAHAQEVLKQYILSVHSTPAGVQIVGEMPKGALRERVAGDFPLLPLVRANYLISVPRDYSLDVLTQGNIETQDIKGTVTLITRGGNIIAGRVASSSSRITPSNPAANGKLQARLETQGGHIFVADVAGDLRAVTVGGHISAGNINGDASLHSGGGHIRAGEISGKTQIETAGGNISVQHAGGNVTASTTGGQIDFGEASGSVRAHTGGGGIRILHVAGPIQLETSDGSICLTRVQGSVRASTGSGTITAWILPVTTPGVPAGPRGPWRIPPRAAAEDKKGPLVPDQLVRLSAASQLESGQGDIIVFLPRQLAANIEATIEKAADHSIEADPGLPVKLISQGSVGSRAGNTIRAEGALNGGGQLLRLRTVSGNIRLRYFDADPALHEMLIRQQKTRLDRQKKIIERRVTFVRETQNEQKDPHAAEPEQTVDSGRTGETDNSTLAEPEIPAAPRGEDRSGLFEQLGRKLEMKVWGGVRVSADELQKHLISNVKPLYPELAKRSGIDGTVQLEIQVNKDGTVAVRKALAGEQLLVNAAIAAVKQWRYTPVVLGGKPVNAISTVAVEFRLR